MVSYEDDIVHDPVLQFQSNRSGAGSPSWPIYLSHECNVRHFGPVFLVPIVML